MDFCRHTYGSFKACLYGGRGPQVGEVTRLGGFPGLPGRVTLLAGDAICHLNVERLGNRVARVAFMIHLQAR